MIEPSEYAVGIWLFGRLLACSYFIAFASLFVQLNGLYGSRGILPIAPLVESIQEVGQNQFQNFPSIFLLNASDRTLQMGCIAGILFSVAAFWGWMEGIWFLLCWLLYLSYATLGRDFLSFQWDSLLLECGFAILLATPLKTDFRFLAIQTPSWASIVVIWLLLFKLMFLSGVVKLASGDPHWRDLTALDFHYWTQPLPNPPAWWMNSLPSVMQKFSVLFTFAIELVLPFLIFINGAARTGAAAGFIVLQVLIALTGNYAFFNFLSIAICFAIVPNSTLAGMGFIPTILPAVTSAFQIGAALIAVPITLSSLVWIIRPFWPSVTNSSIVQHALGSMTPFYLSNPYGLFSVMTTDRPELQIEASMDGNDWRPYRFRYKVGDPRKSLPFVAPHQPRLDWQMWFAAMGSFEQSPWLAQLLKRLAAAEDDVLVLLDTAPFGRERPRFLRIRRAMYTMTRVGDSDAKAGNYWRIGPWQDYSPVFQANP